MTEPLASGDAGIQRRRSTRIVQAVPITVTGTDALGRPFKEHTTTLIVNCHGCKYQSKHYVPKNSTVTLEIPRPDPSLPPLWVQGHITVVQRPRTVRELFQIALEFETPGNVWGIAFPPEDWFPYSEEEAPAIPAPSELAAAQEFELELPVAESEATGPVQVVPEESAEQPPVVPLRPPASMVPPEAHAAPPEERDESRIHFVPSPAPAQEAQLAVARHMTKIVADAKEALDKTIRRDVQTVINEEMTVVRQQLDVQLQDAIERAIRLSIERVSESEGHRFIQQAAHRITEIVEEGRKAAQTSASQLDAKIHLAVEQAVRQATEQPGLTGAQADVAALGSSLRTSLAEVIAKAQTEIQSLGAGLEQERARTEEAKARLQEASRSALEHAQQRLDEMLSTLSDEAGRLVGRAMVQRAQQIEPLLQNAAQRVLDQFSSELDRKFTPRIEEAQKAAAQLANAREQAAQIEQSIRDRVQQASEQAAVELLERLRQDAAKYPAEFEQSCRAALAKMEEELDQRSTEAQHATYEALLKASDWYQKKAQTSMQSALEKAVEQSTGNLRERAAEITRLVASELDHYRRTYVDHSQAQIEEAVRETVERERGRIKETAEIANASFADQTRQVSGESLRRFDQASRQTLEKARSDMEYERETSLAEFQKKLDETVVQGADQARTYLQSQFVPLMEAWEAQGQTQKQEWMEQLNKATEELIQQYRSRLESASTSWLLTSATTLGQNSQAILDTLAQSAEKRLRETFVEVLSGMGDTLKERLIQLSTNFGPENDDPASRKGK